MICEPCRRAADFAAGKAALVIARWLDVVVAGVVPSHDACKGGTWCDCQHKPLSVGRGRS